MGGRFDLMDPVSRHGASGIAACDAENRNALKRLMEEFGFEPYGREWWHYTLIDEPFPDTYFDFVVA
jgi:D-alanyl-D-alanine dipeptidase